MNSSPSGLIVCGTDTDIGKTIVSALLVQGLDAIYWKPIQSGLEHGGDTGQVSKLLNLPKERWIREAYRFHAPVSPHWAAEQENQFIDPEKLQLPLVKKTLVIETAGGLLVPLTRQFLQIDQLLSWKLPVLLVAKSGLGTLNHTLLSIEALRSRNIPLLGLILNGPHHADNPKTLEQIGNVQIIGQLPTLMEINAKTLAEEWEKQNLGPIFKQLLA
ncbi:dethiobiotin synthase [Prochlorococcus sp. MIT 1307]|uniref:dethiobiotin synthase n=1 Tax=Prochlorococcus sp. MIT 1307 TaxID=3096219 RepID=UPI002A75D0ED|nr:dethiobiotin synthase [Prochlorococcus sp. MIT 1307]